MSKTDILYSVCLNKKNVDALIEYIRDEVRLSERSVPKCASMIVDIMKKNISRLQRHPKTKEELKEVAKNLNRMCIDTIIEIISKKYPDLHINKRKHISKEKIKRELEVWPERNNHVQERPYIKPKREYDDEVFYNMQPNDTGFKSIDSGLGGYAAAYSNPLITNVQSQGQNIFNNGHKDTSNFEQHFQQKMTERNQGFGGPARPPTPDFSLDGSGEKVRQEKLMRKMQNDSMTMNNMSSNPGMPGAMNDDLYSNILGAPVGNQNTGPFGNQNTGPFGNQNTGPFGNQNTGPFMGMGNPLMPMSSTNMMVNQYGMTGNSLFNNTNPYDMADVTTQSVKANQLQNDFERKLAERNQVDIETNQPQQNSNSSSGTFMFTNPNYNTNPGTMTYNTNPNYNTNPGTMTYNPLLKT